MSRHNLILHHYWRSSCSWRLRWAMALKKIQYQSQPVNLLKGEHKTPNYLKINPSGTLPCLEVDGVPFTQSLAIIEWLDEQYSGYQIFPTSSVDRLKARELSLVVVADTQPLQNLGPQQYFSSDPTVRSQYAKHWITRGLTAFEQLVRPVAGTFCIGGSVSIADLCLIPQCYNGVRFGIDLSDFPTIQRIYQSALKTVECDASAPHNQPGADA